MKKYRVGIIGLGVGEKHIAGFNSTETAEVVKVCDFSKEKLEEVTLRNPQIPGTINPSDILQDSSINIVSIASYDNFHYTQIMEAIEYGKYIFVEKPICLKFEEAVEIKKELIRHDLRISSNLVLRSCPKFIELKNRILNGAYGQIYNINASYLWGRKHKLTDGWRRDMPFYSIIYGASVHIVDLITWLTGKRPTEVYSVGNKIATKGSSLKYNDFSSGVLKYDNGMIVNVSAHGGCIHPHFHQLEVFGEKKSFVHNLTGSKVIQVENGTNCIVDSSGDYPAKKERYSIIKSFVDSLSNSKKAIVTDEDVFNTISICFALEESLHKNRPVKVKYI